MGYVGRNYNLKDLKQRTSERNGKLRADRKTRLLEVAPTPHTVEFEGFVASKCEGCVTKFAPHKDLKFIA